MTEVNHSNLPQAIAVLLNEVELVKQVALELKRINNSKTNPNERLTRQEVSDEFKISLGTLHNLMKDGKLTFEKVGRKTLFKRAVVESYFQSNSKNLS